MRHLIAVPLLLAVSAAPAAQSSGLATFVVLLGGARIGTEIVDVAKTESGWLISSTGQLRAPFDLITTKFELRYGNDWQPRHLSIEGFLRGQPLVLSTTFGLTTATSEMMQGGQKGSNTKQVSARTVVLPNNFFAGYEALSARLATATVGMRLPVFIAPDGEVSAVVTRVTPRRIVTPTAATDLRQFDLSFATPTGTVDVEVWTDGRNRLARVVLPSPGLSVIRDDLASVMAREETVRNPGDANVFVPAAGFNLAATITRPAKGGTRSPAVVLVAGSGVQDREENRYGVPLFGQLAGALANAGFVVVRYDKRGVGQSGGRSDNATIESYAEDVVAVVNWLRRQKDVDGDRIALLGHDEGAAIALVAAARTDRIKAVALASAPGRTGREVVVEQQQLALARSDDTAANKDARLALQLRVNEAVVSGTGWEKVPPDVRRQADTAWFRSWLLFDPIAAVNRVRQPLLILHGTLDRQVPPAHADLLEQAARGRRNVTAADTQKTIIDGVNHLLVPAKTGETDEYLTLPSRDVSTQAAATVAAWLKSALDRKK